MKAYVYILGYSLLLWGCKADPYLIDPFAVCVATVNGQKWEGRLAGVVSKKDPAKYFDISTRKKGQEYPAGLLTFLNIEKKGIKQMINNMEDVYKMRSVRNNTISNN